MGKLAEGGNFVCCFIIVVMFMGLEEAYRLRGNDNIRGKPQRVGTIFMGAVDSSRPQVKIFI